MRDGRDKETLRTSTDVPRYWNGRFEGWARAGGGLSLGVKKGEGQIKKIRGGNVNIVDDEIVGFKTSVGGIARRLLAISRVLGTEG